MSDLVEKLPGALDLAQTPKASDRRRQGRLPAVSQNLVPLLRDPAAGETDADRVSSQSKACAACREGVELFPFTMAFQPIVDLQESRIDAYEALVRGPAREVAMTTNFGFSRTFRAVLALYPGDGSERW